MTRHNIKGKQTVFTFACGLPYPNDYGISVLPSWNTTVFIAEKTNRGFTLKFGTACPDEGGWIDLTLHTPVKLIISQKAHGGRSSNEGIKLSKEALKDTRIA